jgi:hypothetical protein
VTTKWRSRQTRGTSFAVDDPYFGRSQTMPTEGQVRSCCLSSVFTLSLSLSLSLSLRLTLRFPPAAQLTSGWRRYAEAGVVGWVGSSWHSLLGWIQVQ